jgi:hypothetical protein
MTINKHNILSTFYLSDANNIPKALRLTDLSLDELESIVGYFGSNSTRKGQMRGEVVTTLDKNVIIRASFGKKVLWKKNEV